MTNLTSKLEKARAEAQRFRAEELRLGPGFSRRLVLFALYLVMVSVAFAGPLAALLQFAVNSNLYSHIPLVPFISGYLIWLRRKGVCSEIEGSPVIAGFWGLIGAVTLGVYVLLQGQGWRPALDDYLGLTGFAYLAFVAAGGFLIFGREEMRRNLFPIAFLVFFLPLPTGAAGLLNEVLVRGSAEASAILLKLSGTPFYREGPVFQLPGIAIQVAEECSGIHSTLVLFITSLLAGNLFLRSSWSRAVLAAAVLPVGILRNGLRICTIALLSVHLGPEMIDSPIHRRGGPVFFVLSLFLLGILVALLRWVERRGGDVNTKKHGDK